MRSYERLFFPVNMAMSRRSHGFLMARQSYGNLGVSTELLGVLVGDCLYSNCALTTLPLRVSSCHGAHTAYALCFTALPLLWWRFVCIPCSNLKVITPGPPPSSSAEPAFRQAVALVDCAHQQWHSIFPKPKSYIFVHAGINNTLIIPLIQIYVMRIPLLPLNPNGNLLEVTLTNKYAYWKCSPKLITFYVIQNVLEYSKT